MYSHTPSHPVGDCPELSASVLATFPTEAARSVVSSVVSPVSARLGPQIKPDGVAGAARGAAEAPALKTEAQIDWFMEVSSRNGKKTLSSQRDF